MGTDKSKKGLPGSHGKRKGQYPKYFANTLAKKLRHVEKRNGPEALRAYQDQLFAKRKAVTGV